MELDAFTSFGAFTEVLPTEVRYYGHSDLGDAPDLHRWRAASSQLERELGRVSVAVHGDAAPGQARSTQPRVPGPAIVRAHALRLREVDGAVARQGQERQQLDAIKAQRASAR